jgi:hypothetical protein
VNFRVSAALLMCECVSGHVVLFVYIDRAGICIDVFFRAQNQLNTFTILVVACYMHGFMLHYIVPTGSKDFLSHSVRPAVEPTQPPV